MLGLAAGEFQAGFPDGGVVYFFERHVITVIIALEGIIADRIVASHECPPALAG